MEHKTNYNKMVYSVLVNTLMAYSVYVLDNRVLQIIVLSFIVVFNVFVYCK